MRAGYDNGQLLLCRGNEWKSYLFIDIREMRKPAEEFPQIITIPAGEYLCGIGEGSDIRSAPRMFPELFAQDYDKVVVEVEPFAEKYNYSAPVFELRCSLPKAFGGNDDN